MIARPWTVPVLLLLAGASLAIVYIASSVGERPPGPGTPPELRDLIATVNAQMTRPVRGRLTGSWAYVPPRPFKRGAVAPATSPELLIAAARIEQTASADDSPANRAALGVARLVVGDLDHAIEALEDAVQRDEGNARFHNDLAAALLARAEAGASGEDWAAALDAAERAVKRDPASVEAYFNRALALGGLHLTEQAIDAHAAYQRAESSGEWFDESMRHLQELRRSMRPSLPWDGGEGWGEGAWSDRPVDHQLVRERIEDRLLPAWGRAVRAGQRDEAAAALGEATRLSSELADAGGDTMAWDEVRRIERAHAESNAAALRDLAGGHVLFGQAREEYVRDNQQRAAELMTKAAVPFTRARSPYAAWAPVFRSIWLRNYGDGQRALDEALRVDIARFPVSYHHLRGRVAWASAVPYNERGREDRALEHMRRAVAEYQTAGEVDNLIATRTIVAASEWVLGNTARAWSNLLGVLEHISVNGGSRRDYHLWVGSALAQQAGLLHAASVFDDARVAASKSPRSLTEAYLNRARTRALSRDHSRAMEDLERAEEAVAVLDDTALRERNLTDIRLARAKVLSDIDCRASLAHLSAAESWVLRSNSTFRIGELLGLRAKCREALGDLEGARAVLQAAVEMFEQKRSNLESIHDRTEAFERERSVFKRLIELEVDLPGGTDRALAVAERARAGALLENWNARAIRRVEPAVGRRDLPSGTAILYFETLATKTLVWVISRDQIRFFTSPVGERWLERSVARITRRIRDGATVRGLAPETAELVNLLIRPALDAAGDAGTVFFVPDGPMHALPFSALPDEHGRPLLATRNIGVAPSLAGFLAASERLTDFAPTSVLTVGDGHDPRATGLPLLRWADIEATRIGDLYPTRTVLAKGLATKARLLRDDADVLHFAGHTIASERFPQSSRLLLAPGDASFESDAWLASEIVEHRFVSTRLVVLSTCDSAAGRFVSGEGLLSVGRAFFAAGVPSVIASLWPVDDDVIDLMVAFHRELRSGTGPARALRTVQLGLLESAGSDVPIRRWGGFVAYGGAAPSVSNYVHPTD